MNRTRLVIAIVVLFGVMGLITARPESAAALSCGPCPASATADVNLRAEPSVSAAILDVIPAGAALEWDPLQDKVDGFVAVSYNGSDGWADGDYLLLFPLGATTTAALNVHAEPSLDAEIRGVIPVGTQVMVISGPENGFFSVRFEQEQIFGWASGDYLTLGGRTDPVEPVETLPNTGAGTTTDTSLNDYLIAAAALGLAGAAALTLKTRATS
ncbi:MAG: SH3 domain-containing protein [Thermomicrobiales bacterium]